MAASGKASVTEVRAPPEKFSVAVTDPAFWVRKSEPSPGSAKSFQVTPPSSDQPRLFEFRYPFDVS